jgi:hypothetical protein
MRLGFGCSCSHLQPMAHWTLHDLRRTAATGMARLGTQSICIQDGDFRPAIRYWKLRELGHPIPAARDLEAVRADISWATENEIDWSKVVVNLIKLDWRSRKGR